MTPRPRTSCGARGGWLLLAAGVVALVGGGLPGLEHLGLGALDTVGLGAVLAGLVCLRLPWQRQHLRALARFGHTQRELPHRVGRLARIATGLGADLDAGLVRQRLCDGAVELFDAAGAVVLGRGAEGPVVLAGSGAAPAAGAVLPAAALHLARPSPVAVAAPALGLGSGGAVLVACCSEPEPLVLCLLPGGRELGREDADLLRLLVTQGAAALANAALRAVAVAQRRHEQAVVDVLADGVLVLDARGRLLTCNDEAAGLLGAAREALLGSAVPVALGADGTPVHGQLGGRWIETVATRLGDAGERVVTMRDISRQRALEDAEDLFLATTSHELRTPLTAIKGYVHVLQRRWDDLDERARLDALATIAERTDALVALTNHLLLGARAGASRHSAARVPFDLLGAVASATAAFATASGSHVVRVAGDSQPVQALGDATNVPHIIGQLLENAVKYSPHGGAVDVRVRPDGVRAVVEVADEGVGLPPGEEASLFDRFSQAGETNTREFGGVGLGLYIVRQLVEAQGGSVFARNRADVGAVVGFTLPLAVAPPAPRDGGDAHARGGRRSG